MDADAGPCQAWPGSSEVTELNAFAAELNSLPIPSQAAAASNIGPVPGPSSSSTELTSGGHTEKLITAPLDQVSSSPCSNVPHRVVRQSQLDGGLLPSAIRPKATSFSGLRCWVNNIRIHGDCRASTTSATPHAHSGQAARRRGLSSAAIPG